ncbi:4'-phosphopantetheinyl transferase [Duganella sacchari]|uniref:4'-phosphopantetheinyl transferase n=1 Tax=Duganella sacchari TaxID=551987 RepID=A0A1M7KX38_9BURK|nr:4'-phosphopantetheinyl transferase superfamily protein [Duganella sacchari]SHM70210.1 4'-phosphopantetheinyl transferase [Duganella sacchari]
MHSMPYAPARRPPAGELHAWMVQLDDCLATDDDCLEVLDQSERARAGRFAFAPLRRRYLAAHAALRGILGHTLGLAPEQVALSSDANGKPRLADGMPPLSFNLSHSHGMAVVALAPQGEIGIDIECCAPLPLLLPLVRRHFSVQEKHAFWTLDENQRLAGFYRWWTGKEACLKALGVGLSSPLDGFSIEFRPGYALRMLEAPAPMASMQLLPLHLQQPGWCGAVALADTQPPVLRMRHWSWHGWRM